MTDLHETSAAVRFRLEQLEPKPGDLLVLTYPQDQEPDGDQAKLVAEMIAAKLPESVTLILIPDGWRLELQQVWKMVKDRRVVVERPQKHG